MKARKLVSSTITSYSVRQQNSLLTAESLTPPLPSPVGTVIVLLLFSFNLDAYASYTVQSIGMLWLATSTVAIIFVPKIYKLFLQRQSNTSATPSPPKGNSSALDPLPQPAKVTARSSRVGGTVYEEPPSPIAAPPASSERTSGARSEHTQKSYFESSHAYYSRSMHSSLAAI